MSKTYFIEKTPVADAAAALTGIPNDIDTPAVIPAATATPLKIDTVFDFIDLLSTTVQARRFVMWMTANSLNNFAIGNIQSQMRRDKYALNGTEEINQDIEYLRAQGIDEKGIDLYNEQLRAIAELKDSATVRYEQGFEAEITPIEVAEYAIAIRAYVAKLMVSYGKGPRDAAQTIGESIAFRLSRAPRVDEKQVLRLHAVSGIPLDVLRKADLQNKMSERQALIEQAGQIEDTATSLGWKSVPDASEVEALFDKLPVQTQYRLIGNICRSLKMAMDAEVKALIKFGRLDSVTNRVLIGDVMQGYITYFREFTSRNADALVEYEERGFALPTLEQLLADRDD